tara:strand:- start:1141 stop:1500 length:360 start_codon:yes stop_codon:yes gene_type:complete
MSNTKELLVTTIKEWVECERKIKEFNSMMKEYKDKKKLLTKSLVDVMKNNEIDCFDINDGQIVHKTLKTKAPVSKQYLSQILQKCFEDHPEINCDEVGNAILENRPVKERHSIVMKQNK